MTGVFVFLPFVNLHQEHYWWPDESASGEYRLLGRGITIRGSILRYYFLVPDHRGMAAERNLYRRRDRLDAKRLTIGMIETRDRIKVSSWQFERLMR